tara:strand:- start:449 stop:907 length:459 start_codon:yes stop_codon:yes gene_type:complete
MKKIIDISIIIPCYNEKQNLHEIIDKINFLKKNYTDKVEFIIVDNGSDDGSNEILKNITNPNFTTIHLNKNLGYGGAIIKGINNAKGLIIAWTHGDIQCDLNDVMLAYHGNRKSLKSGNFVVKGKRINRKLINYFFFKINVNYCIINIPKKI